MENTRKASQLFTLESHIKELTALADCANLSIDEVLEDDMTMKEAKKKLEAIILENHKYKIYYSESEKSWRTYLPDDTKVNGRRPIKRSSKENLEKAVIEHYKAKNRGNISLSELFAEFMIYRRNETSTQPATIRKNSSEWNKFFKNSILADMRVADITPIILIRFFRKLTKDREYTRQTITNIRSLLSGIFSYAVEEEIISHNPILDVDFKKLSYKPVERQSDNVFTREEAQKLLAYLQDINEPYSLAIQLSFNLFIRIGETKALKWENIDFGKRTVNLNSQLLQEPTLNDDLTFSRKETKVENYTKGCTSHGFRKEYLTDDAIRILEKAKEINPNGEFVFMPYGRPMTTDRFNIYLRRYCEKAGISYHSSHKIRFYTASTAFNGSNLVDISRMMGHSQTATTMHYLRDVMQDDNLTETFKNLGFQG